MQSKRQMDYERVFGKLLESRSTLALSSNLLDFEKATLQAAVNVFPGATIAGCLFHLGQSLWSRIQNEGLANNYREQDHTEQLIAGFNAANQTAVSSKNKYIQVTRRLTVLLPTYGTRPLLEFLMYRLLIACQNNISFHIVGPIGFFS